MTTESAKPSPDSHTRTEVIAREPVECLAGILDIEQPTVSGLVPPLWHWLYLLDRWPQRDLGPDGHPTSGIPAPPERGLRRMFAGGRVQTYRLLQLGRTATRAVRVTKKTEKHGRTGPLTFVTVRHEISQDGRLAIVEEQDIVYRAAGTNALPSTASAGPAPLPNGPHLLLEVTETLLFRFSAVTYNAHRIHYDRRWAEREGYDDLVVHGPLQVLMMGELLRRTGVAQVGHELAFRLIAPMVGPQSLIAAAGEWGLAAGAQIRDATGRVTAASVLTPLPPPPPHAEEPAPGGSLSSGVRSVPEV